MKLPKLFHIVAKRKELRLSQHAFWSNVGVGQSTGCRLEHTTKLPRPVQVLLHLVYGTNPLKLLAELRGVSIDELISGKKSAKLVAATNKSGETIGVVNNGGYIGVDHGQRR